MIGMAVFLVAATFGVGLLYWGCTPCGSTSPKVKRCSFRSCACWPCSPCLPTHLLGRQPVARADRLAGFRHIVATDFAALDGIASANGRRQATFGWHGPTRSARRHLTPRLSTPGIPFRRTTAGPSKARKRRKLEKNHSSGSRAGRGSVSASHCSPPAAIDRLRRADQPLASRHRERSLFGSLAGRRETRHGLVPEVLFDRRGKSRSLPPYRTDTRVGHGRGPCCPCCGGGRRPYA